MTPMTRRRFCAFIAPAAIAALRANASAAGFRLALCNKTFEGKSFSEMCRLTRETGFTGMEIAPYTLSDDPASIPASALAERRATMAAEGISYVGLHSVLNAPPGMSVTTPDPVVRRRSWDYFRRLIDVCADLGDNGTMVFLGNPQRRTVDGATVTDAVARIKEGLSRVAPAAQDRHVTIMVEPLAPHLCDVINTLDEAMGVVRAVNSPAVQTMLDTHNTAGEKEPLAGLIRRYYPQIRHVHFNELDGRHPGTGHFDFKTVMQTLKGLGYDRWISIEAFQFKPDGATVARESARFLRKIEAELT
jgi:D-psicose/D-tagatose/L-ribulose 3-epimerase